MTRETCDVCGNDTISPQKTKRGDVFCPSCWEKFKKSVGGNDEPPATKGPMHDANEESFDKWADSYDALNGAPENDDDR